MLDYLVMIGDLAELDLGTKGCEQKHLKDVNGNATYEWSSDKTDLVKSDFSPSQKNSIYDKSLAEICAFDITGKISK